MIEIEQLLESIGLTKQESRCFIALYELKEAKTGILSKKSAIATANIYPVLDSLMKKGLASYKMINNTKVFMPSTVESFNILIEDKQKQLDEQKSKVQEAILALKQGNEPEEFSNYKYFTGIRGIKSMWIEILEMMRQAKPSTLVIFSTKRTSSEPLRAFYDDFHKERRKLGHRYKLILSEEDAEHAKKRAKEGDEVKITKLSNEAAFGAFNNIFFTYFITGKPSGFLIKDAKTASSYKIQFEELWKNLK